MNFDTVLFSFFAGTLVVVFFFAWMLLRKASSRSLRRNVPNIFVSSLVLQVPFLMMLFTGPHGLGSWGFRFFLPGFLAAKHMPPPLDFEPLSPRHSQLGGLLEV